MLYPLIKPLLFSLDPESAHHFALKLASLSPTLGELTGARPDSKLSVKVGSLEWTFPIGLAAGLDKNAEALPFFAHQGFGAIECGTVTLRPQDGNPRPRMFRYPGEKSLRNAMGFPNQGLGAILSRIKHYRGPVPLGINLGKNKETEVQESIEELSLMLETMNDDAAYFVVNVSSPNTPGLRALQEKSYLTELFSELNRVRGGKDLYLKIAPDLEREKIIELTHLVSDLRLTGLIATNTTIIPERGIGGVSGLLLREKSQEVRQIILQEETGLELIAVGGIAGPEDLFRLWSQGGKAAQVYTAYVYEGPALLKRFKRDVQLFLHQQGLNLNEFFCLELAERQYRLKDFL